MKTIKSLISISPRYISDKHYGVEIEIEGTSLPPVDSIPSKWRVERDSSLKTAEAWEYVLKMPDTVKGVEASVAALSETFKATGSKVDESVRAGVHVHMNVQDWNIRQLMTFSTCYYILEDLLLRWCGPNREGNLFAMRTRDAEFVLFKVLDCIEKRNLKGLSNDIIRYASLNYCSLFKYGTVEFRGMRSTPDLNLIVTWVKVLDELRSSSLRFSSPAEVLDQMSGDGEEQFLATLLPTYHKLFAYEGADRAIRNAARRVQMIAYGIDWNTISAPKINIFDTTAGEF